METHFLEEHVERVRRFNRFYTRRIGVLHEHLLGSGFSLTQARVLYELAHRPTLSTSTLCRELGLNAGYLSRLVAGFEKEGLIEKTRSPADARVHELRLTEEGRATFGPLDDASRRDAIAMLQRLSEPERLRLVEAMGQIQGLLDGAGPGYLLREPRPGDLGWIVHRQAVLYAEEYGWNAEYEALAAEIVAKFVRELDPKSERCWVAEKGGKVAGSVFVVRDDDATAKLRLLYVEPEARGLGIGRRLVDECLAFARLAGYRRMTLWTNSVLAGARRIYEEAGFRLIKEEPHRSFGKDLVAQTWCRDL
ncbi:Mycothiol acetyltransferase [Aquisphaera giovannonii]|uniref:Mycothiol acetyltransferase n=1 Tax=Aquisphaera giovannonii TaxID=406548 RepID=A0A5B9VT97_9BACT|nr:bifunctional helix-turn-helix transcriptional regulator/GNAT family N-acetyltransferase [Aquisphaera giovannonii]QEH31726.1 Mycothiol acetyltransferase [Aquisphaera giovannonii]